MMKFQNKMWLLPISLFLFCSCSTFSGSPPPEQVSNQQKAYSPPPKTTRLSRENQSDIRELNAKIATMEQKLKILADEAALVSSNKIDELENKITILSEELRYLDKRFNENMKNEKSVQIPNTFSPNPTISAQKTQFDPNEAKDYKRATDLFYARKYQRANQSFLAVKKKYPKGSFADNASFWSGECQFAMGDFEKAIKAYEATFTYPNTEKADDAQFKIGRSYLRLGKKKQAVIELKKLLSLYPNSEYVARAQIELKKIR